jgi:hypothetical protein
MSVAHMKIVARFGKSGIELTIRFTMEQNHAH